MTSHPYYPWDPSWPRHRVAFDDLPSSVIVEFKKDPNWSSYYDIPTRGLYKIIDGDWHKFGEQRG